MQKSPVLLGWLTGIRVSCLVFLCCLSAAAQPPALDGLQVYQALKRFQLSGAVLHAEKLVLKRDRVEMTFDGVFYLEAPVEGKVHGAVFLGTGQLRAPVPPNQFEREQVRRMLKAENSIDSDFRTAVLRFTDDTADLLGKAQSQGQVTPEAEKLAATFEPRLLKETGANVSARLAVSILNRESPGFFIAEFDQGRRDRFTFLLDHQGRIPAATFGINGGEKGLLFAYRGVLGGADVWMAFYGLKDYERGTAEYSDVFDLAAVDHYALDVDVRNPRKVLKVEARMDFQSRVNGLRAIPMSLSESLPEFENMRLKKAMRVKSIRSAGGATLTAVQEDWEGGLTLFLPEALPVGARFSVMVDLAGDFMFDSPSIPDCFYPLSNSEWYPRHGYLGRSRFDLRFLHHKAFRVSAPGVLVGEGKAADDDSDRITEWKMDTPVALVTFGVGRFERHTEMFKGKQVQVPVEFYSMPGSVVAIKEDFILAEMQNCLEYFSLLFGRYPYGKFGAVYHPRGFGQGFASMLLIPAADRSSKYTYAFIAHETAHQWWGNVVAWRSYRDQWLSEGFAEYSGILYTRLRDKHGGDKDLLDNLRRSLKQPPRTETGIGKGKLADIGPLILGHRLSTRETFGAYTTLIYNKGALVLRMLHFLFTNFSSGDDKPFFDMMSDFVRRHHNGWATTDTFRAVANEHFARSAIAQKYRMKDLDWFFQQWVYEAHYPSYRLHYSLEDQPDGGALLTGAVYQDNVPDNWFMPLPLVMEVSNDKVARGTVHALGKNTPIKIKLPFRPRAVKLDPDLWILSEKTETNKR